MRTATQNKKLPGLTVLLVVFGAAARLLPHPPNFAPIDGLALYGGDRLNKFWKILIPILAMFFSDLFLPADTWKMRLVIYLTIGTIALGASLLKLDPSKNNLAKISLAALAAGLFFFIVTNGAVWALGGFYPKTFNGLIICYIAGLPFLKWTLLGDLFYSNAIFGLDFAVRRLSPTQKLALNYQK